MEATCCVFCPRWPKSFIAPWTSGRCARWCKPARRSSPFGTARTGSCSPNWEAIWTGWEEEEPNGWGPLKPSQVESPADRHLFVATSRCPDQAVGTAWGGGARHLGWDGVRKAGKPGARGIVRGAIEQSGSPDARQTGLLSSAWRSHFRARHAWDRSALSRSASQLGTSEFDQHALVEFAWSASQ